MINELVNDASNEMIAFLNDKIRQYNNASAAKKVDTNLCLNLLQEINHLSNKIQLLLIDSYELAAELDTISSFEGIAKELVKYGLPGLTGKSADVVLTNFLKLGDGIPTLEQWNERITRHPFYFSILSKKVSPQGESVNKALMEINEEKQGLAKKPSPDHFQKYHDRLQIFKQDLLEKISSAALGDKKDIQNFRTLLAQVNHEIVQMQGSIPKLKSHNQHIYNQAMSTLSQDLAQVTGEKLVMLISLLRNPDAISNKKDLVLILPSLANFKIEKLGGSNNINWKLTNPESGQQFVFQIDVPNTNQALIARLGHTVIDQSLAQEYSASITSADNPYRLVLTDYAVGGDIRNKREVELSAASNEDLIQSSIKQLGELTSVCQSLLENNVLHPDIKLTNFLTDSQGNIVIADKKAFTAVDEEGCVLKNGLLTTKLYAPPEYNQASALGKKMNAEAFMSYQLGLAMYDYLLLPKISNDPQVPAWCENPPLDFNHPIFDSAQGLQIKTLIEQMTDKNPNARPSLQSIQQQMISIQQLASSLSNVSGEQMAAASSSSLVSVGAWREQAVTARHHSKQDVTATAQMTIDSKSQLQQLKLATKGLDEKTLGDADEGEFELETNQSNTLGQ